MEQADRWFARELAARPINKAHQRAARTYRRLRWQTRTDLRGQGTPFLSPILQMNERFLVDFAVASARKAAAARSHYQVDPQDRSPEDPPEFGAASERKQRILRSAMSDVRRMTRGSSARHRAFAIAHGDAMVQLLEHQLAGIAWVERFPDVERIASDPGLARFEGLRALVTYQFMPYGTGMHQIQRPPEPDDLRVLFDDYVLQLRDMATDLPDQPYAPGSRGEARFNRVVTDLDRCAKDAELVRCVTDEEFDAFRNHALPVHRKHVEYAKRLEQETDPRERERLELEVESTATRLQVIRALDSPAGRGFREITEHVVRAYLAWFENEPMLTVGQGIADQPFLDEYAALERERALLVRVRGPQPGAVELPVAEAVRADRTPIERVVTL